MKFFQSVVLLLLVASCATPSKERPAGSAAPAQTTPALLPPGSGAAPTAAPVPTPAPVPAPAASTAAVPQPDVRLKAGGSAYGGCGQPIASARLWDETAESEVLEAISEAKACAAQHGRRLLLEFVAPWCADCQEMAKLDETPAVAETLRRRFERVRINIGKWDRHEALRESFGVRALATYIVIDPKSSKQLAQTTLEPITRPGKKLTAEDWRLWLERH